MFPLTFPATCRVCTRNIKGLHNLYIIQNVHYAVNCYIFNDKKTLI